MTIATAAPWAKSWPRNVVSNMKIEGRSLASAGPPLREHEDEVEHLQRRVAEQDDARSTVIGRSSGRTMWR